METALITVQQSQTRIEVQVAALDTTVVTLWTRSKNSPHTRRAYLQDIAKFYELVGKPLQTVTLQDLLDYRDALAERFPKVATRRRLLYAVKSLLTFAQKQGYMVFNVGAGLQPPKGKDALAERILSPAQVQHIIYEAQRNGTQRDYVLLLLLYASGIRCEEVCNLQWKDVRENGETGQITVFGKERETRAVLLHPKAWQALQTILPDPMNPEQYVFTSRQTSFRRGLPSQRLTESRVWQIVSRTAERAGVKASPHYFRHAHATHTMGKVSQRIIQETLGWKSPLTMMRYQHVLPQESSSLVLDI